MIRFVPTQSLFVRAGWGLAWRLPITLVASPWILSLWAYGPECFRTAGDQTDCFVDMLTWAPMAAVFGPLAHDAEPPPDLRPLLLLIALLLAAAWTVIAALIGWARRERPTRSRGA